MVFIGIDLSGPSNVKDTALACFQLKHGRLELLQIAENVSDGRILALAAEHIRLGKVAVGLDAPLSYNQGGGDRPSDKALRQRLVMVGLHPGSVMPPTMTRMVYLTLRGMAVAHLLGGVHTRPPHVVEVHPGGAMALRGAPIPLVRSFKRQMSARLGLLSWLQEQGLSGISGIQQPTDHLVAACATALATWKWQIGDSAWLASADRPSHPFDFAC